MSNTHNSHQQKDDTLERWRNLTLSTRSTSSQHQSQPSPARIHLQLQSGQRQHQSQPIKRQEQPKQDEQKKESKCRGNRKRQRYRAKLRKRGLNNETITTLIENCNHGNQGQDEEQSSTVPDMDVEVLVSSRGQVRLTYIYVNWIG